MIVRDKHTEEIIRRLGNFEVVAILGPRQIGKTTLARQVAERYHTQTHHFDLEDPAVLSRLEGDAKLTLQHLKGLVIIDEIQRLADLFPLLRVLSDRRPGPARFLVLGSASPNLLRQSSESLAGRINYYELGGLGLDETGNERLDRRWLRGGFPKAYLSRSDRDCFEWLESFTRTFIERDLAQLGVQTPGTTLRRFWTMLAHRHGQIWNSSEFARSFGVADTTVRRYLDILTDALVVRQLAPWFAEPEKASGQSAKSLSQRCGTGTLPAWYQRCRDPGRTSCTRQHLGGSVVGVNYGTTAETRPGILLLAHPYRCGTRPVHALSKNAAGRRDQVIFGADNYLLNAPCHDRSRTYGISRGTCR